MTRTRNTDGTFANEGVRARLIRRTARVGRCLEWTGPRTENGYGRLCVRGRNQLAHRVAWEMVNGPIANGLSVCHHCDNRACVEPSHLFLGTNQDNVTDMVIKGRKNPARGEAVRTARLTADDVAEMRRLKLTEGLGCRRLAERFGVTHSTVARVLRGETWK